MLRHVNAAEKRNAFVFQLHVFANNNEEKTDKIYIKLDLKKICMKCVKNVYLANLNSINE